MSQDSDACLNITVQEQKFGSDFIQFIKHNL